MFGEIPNHYYPVKEWKQKMEKKWRIFAKFSLDINVCGLEDGNISDTYLPNSDQNSIHNSLCTQGNTR